MTGTTFGTVLVLTFMAFLTKGEPVQCDDLFLCASLMLIGISGRRS